MPISLRFKQLQTDISSVRRDLLPRNFNPTGTYHGRVYSRTRGFRLLAYAHFEEFLEDRVREIATQAYKAWDKSGKASSVLLCLLGFSDAQMKSPPSTKAPAQANAKMNWAKLIDINEKIKLAYNRLDHALKTNHGIKEENLLNLLLTVGIKATEIDDLWLVELNEYGKIRGQVAHTGSMQHALDPKEEVETSKRVLNIFRDIDKLLNQLQ